MDSDRIKNAIKTKDAGELYSAFQFCFDEVNAGHYEYAGFLVKMYQYGLGVEKNEQKAQAVLEEVFEKTGSEWCKRDLANLLYTRCSKDAKICFELTNDLYSKKEPRSIGMMARLYRDGIGVDRDPEKAASLFEESYQRGVVWAGFELIDLLSTSDDYDSLHRAFEVCKELAECGDAKAMGMLARMYRDGIGIAPDRALAIQWYRGSSEKGTKWAMKELMQLLKG